MPKFLLHLLMIRLKQAGRALWGVGWLLVLALPMAGIFLFVIWDKLSSLQPPASTAILAFLFFSLHWQRKDLAFLKKCDQPVPLIVLVEYQLTMLLFTLPIALLSASWTTLLWSHLIVGLIAFLPSNQPTVNQRTFDVSFFLKDQLEWIGGIRKNWKSLLPIYLAGLIFSFYIAGTLLSMVFMLLIILGFYDELENRMLLEKALQRHFLWKKWISHYRLFCILFLPHIGLYLFFHVRYWYFLLFILAISGIFLACAIFYKYSTYLPGRRKANSQTPISILFLTLIIPFLAPLSLIALFIFHRRAQRRLQYFFPYAAN